MRSRMSSGRTDSTSLGVLCFRSRFGNSFGDGFIYALASSSSAPSSGSKARRRRCGFLSDRRSCEHKSLPLRASTRGIIEPSARNRKPSAFRFLLIAASRTLTVRIHQPVVDLATLATRFPGHSGRRSRRALASLDVCPCPLDDLLEICRFFLRPAPDNEHDLPSRSLGIAFGALTGRPPEHLFM